MGGSTCGIQAVTESAGLQRTSLRQSLPRVGNCSSAYEESHSSFTSDHKNRPHCRRQVREQYTPQRQPRPATTAKNPTDPPIGALPQLQSSSAQSPLAEDVREVLRRLMQERRLTDPLQEFCESIEARSLARFGETVNLTPLITAARALAHWTSPSHRLTDAWHVRRQNLRQVLESLSPFARSVIHPSLTSAAALVHVKQIHRSCGLRRASCAVRNLRVHLARHHITASEPVAGFARLAMPDVLLPSGQTTGICKAFDCLTQPRHDTLRPWLSVPVTACRT
jgi:hypothetical protein